jgi:hypothetical protein
MRTKIIVAGVVLLALALFTAPRAFGCVPDDGGSSRCAQLPASNYPVPVTALQIAAKDPPAQPTPTGNSPQTARIPMYVKPQYCIEAMCPGAVNAPPLNAPGNWTWIDGNSSTWYRINDGHGLQVQLWLFANGQKGLSFDVYAPDQKDLYGKPVGRGALDKSQASVGADLFYSGRSQAYGTWYVRVTNGNSYPVSYSMRFTLTTPTLSNSCDDCHRIIGYDWSACNGSTFCQDLHQLYDCSPSGYSHDVTADIATYCR